MARFRDGKGWLYQGKWALEAYLDVNDNVNWNWSLTSLCFTFCPAFCAPSAIKNGTFSSHCVLSPSRCHNFVLSLPFLPYPPFFLPHPFHPSPLHSITPPFRLAPLPIALIPIPKPLSFYNPSRSPSPSLPVSLSRHPTLYLVSNLNHFPSLQNTENSPTTKYLSQPHQKICQKTNLRESF